MLHFKTAIVGLVMGIGKLPCAVPPVELDPENGDELFLEVRNRNGEISTRIKVDILGAKEKNLAVEVARSRRIMEKARRAK